MWRGAARLLGFLRQAAAEVPGKRTISSGANSSGARAARGSRGQLWWQAVAAAGVAGGLAWKWYSSQGHTPRENCALCRIALDGNGLPEFSREEVARHRSREAGGRVWVTYRDGVYDITDFLDYHPGGDGRIMQAAGGPIDPFWVEYPRHLSGQAERALADYQIGKLKPEGPTTKEGGAHAPPVLPAHLADVDEGEFRLRVVNTVDLSLDDLRRKFPKHSMAANLKCAPAKSCGSGSSSVTGEGGGTGSGAALWGGALLRDVLRAAGVREGDPRLSSVQFESLDGGQNPPLNLAQPGYHDALLAYEVDGQLLKPAQGAPLRLVVPGAGGRRNVKWVSKISVGSEQSAAMSGAPASQQLQQP